MIRLLSILAAGWLLSACSSTPSAATPKEPVELGDPSDDVDPKAIGEAVRGSSARFQRCYEVARERNPSLSGRIEVRFLINSDGSVGQAMAAETDLPPQVADCVVNTFYSLSLPQQKGAVVAQYPMYFQPS